MKNKLLIPMLLLGLCSQAFAGSAKFYTDSGFQGESVTTYTDASVHSTSRSFGSAFHDSISSMKVELGTCVALFFDKGFAGAYGLWGPGEYSSINVFNDEVSSVHVIDSPFSCHISNFTRVFRDSYFENRSILLPRGFQVNKLKGAELWYYDFNNDFSSAQVPSHSCLRLYKDENLTGDYLSIKSWTASFSQYNFNDKASSLVVLSASDCPTEGVTTSSGGGGGTGGGGSGGGTTIER